MTKFVTELFTVKQSVRSWISITWGHSTASYTAQSCDAIAIVRINLFCSFTHCFSNNLWNCSQGLIRLEKKKMQLRWSQAIFLNAHLREKRNPSFETNRIVLFFIPSNRSAPENFELQKNDPHQPLLLPFNHLFLCTSYPFTSLIAAHSLPLSLSVNDTLKSLSLWGFDRGNNETVWCWKKNKKKLINT